MPTEVKHEAAKSLRFALIFQSVSLTFAFFMQSQMCATFIAYQMKLMWNATALSLWIGSHALPIFVLIGSMLVKFRFTHTERPK